MNNTKQSGKKSKDVKVWAIKHLPSNNLLLPVCPTKDDAVKLLFNNYIGPSLYFKIVQVLITELPLPRTVVKKVGKL